jgi:hypothetical protein
MKGVIDAAAKQAQSGGKSIGTNLSHSIAVGITAGTPFITAAAVQAVAAAIRAAKAEAGIASPSKKMFKLGLDLMTGLQNGITDNQQKVIDAAQKVIDETIKLLEKNLAGLERRLDKVMGKADEFRGAISGAFGSFMDLSGGFSIPPTPEALTPEQLAAQAAAAPTTASALDFLQEQLASAQQFAAVLKALQQAGASKDFLAQIASAGPEALPFAQALLQGGPSAVAEASGAFDAINALAEKTAGNLTNKFYGEKMDKLQAKVDQLHEDLRDLNHPKGNERDVIEIVVHTDMDATVELFDQALAKKGKHNVRLAHHGKGP